MCKCNPSIRTPFCRNCLRCAEMPPLKQSTINKAISTGDLISIDGTVVRPISLDGGELSYMDMTELNEYVVDINDLDKVEEYE